MNILCYILIFKVLFTILVNNVDNKIIDLQEICHQHYAKRVFLEFEENGTLVANFRKSNSNLINNSSNIHNKCSVEFITCPSCVIHIKFKYLNISRVCGKSTVYDTCGCDYVWIYEPPFEEASGEQFCGRFVENTSSSLSYISQTKNVAITFLYSTEYDHAFTLEYTSERNKVMLIGQPTIPNMNNGSQTLSSPFFPFFYPSDLSVEYVINCESLEPCRISLVFSDFQLDASSMIEFFDWNGQRMYVTSGSIFRPPVIISNGPSLTVRFYANGAFSYGFKASYSFILGNLEDMTFKPDIGCGGYVNNLGGGITMMNMLSEGTKYFDCVWILTPPHTTLHLKTHLYVKVVTFADFVGTTELTIRQGQTSNEPMVETLKQSLSYFSHTKEKEHVVPISQGFYITLKGLFRPSSHLAIVYAAFNYKDCYAGSDFLCHNFRCISTLLTCDGFDHCGDNSDELSTCSEGPKDRRYMSKTPNFLFPKSDRYSDITTATMIFLICGFGLIGIILAMALLLYRVNMRTRHHRDIQNHIETIHAILEESVGEVEEELIIPDDPPDYEAPPEYNEAVKKSAVKKKNEKRCVRCNLNLVSPTPQSTIVEDERNSILETDTASTSQTTPLPKSPPPPYMKNNDVCIRIAVDEETQSISDDTPETKNNPVINESTTLSICLNQIKSVLNLNEIGTSISRSFKNYKHEVYLKKRNDILIKYNSAFELEYYFETERDNFWPSINKTCFGRSFSTDNISSLF